MPTHAAPELGGLPPCFDGGSQTGIAPSPRPPPCADLSDVDCPRSLDWDSGGGVGLRRSSLPGNSAVFLGGVATVVSPAVLYDRVVDVEAPR